jgi:hypothetical protein
LGRGANASVTSVPSSMTRTPDGSVPAGSSTATKASPAETRSARFDSTAMSRPPAVAAEVGPATETRLAARARPSVAAVSVTRFVVLVMPA